MSEKKAGPPPMSIEQAQALVGAHLGYPDEVIAAEFHRSYNEWRQANPNPTDAETMMAGAKAGLALRQALKKRGTN